jgi:3-oxoacyl-[acyl-carrier-protein] synthase II
MRRAAITGIGVISSLGEGLQSVAGALRSGRCGIGELTAFELPGSRSRWAAQAGEPVLPDAIGSARRFTRADRLAMVAAMQALEAAGLEAPERREAAVVIGTGTGGISQIEAYHSRLAARGERRTPARWLAAHQPANACDLLANRLGLCGPRLSLMTACSSSATALGVGLDMIRLGRARRVLAGGTEALCRLTYGGFSALRAMDDQPCRPFHAERKGLTLGEGAAMMVLEDLELCRSRGARPLVELAGYGVSADAHHLTAPAPGGRGAVAAMLAALHDAEVCAEEVQYINAHGTGTPHNDPAEVTAIRTTFGSHAEKLAVSSTKAMHGHTLGAAGAIEAVVCAAAIQEGFIPPTLRLDRADPACDLDLVPLQGRPTDLSVVLSNSFAFGGNNTTLVLRRIA